MAANIWTSLFHQKIDILNFCRMLWIVNNGGKNTKNFKLSFQNKNTTNVTKYRIIDIFLEESEMDTFYTFIKSF